MPKKPNRQTESLTAVELEMMTIIWRLGPSTIAEMLAATDRGLAYTSVSTIVRILEQKGFVASDKAGRGHRYRATLAKETFQATTLKHVIANVFDGTPAMLVRRLLASDVAMDPAELAAIKKMLREV